MAVVMAKQQGLGYGTYYSSQPNKGAGKTQRMIIVGVIVAAVIGLGLFALNLMSGSGKSDMTLLAVRENSLLTLANASDKSIRDPDLATANSNATILLTSDVNNIIADTGIKKLPDDLVKKEADTNADTLKQANLLNKFDTTYHQIVLQKVSALVAQAQTVRTSVTSKKSRAVIDHVITNLQSIEKQFSDVKL
jgi:hypothetical protein